MAVVVMSNNHENILTNEGGTTRKNGFFGNRVHLFRDEERVIKKSLTLFLLLSLYKKTNRCLKKLPTLVVFPSENSINVLLHKEIIVQSYGRKILSAQSHGKRLSGQKSLMKRLFFLEITRGFN